MNRRISWAKWGLLLARIAVSGIFLAAGLLKLKDAELTLIAIFQYQLVSWEHAGLLGALLPWFEIVGALGLWWPKGRLGAAALCSGLTLVFLAALGSAVARDLDITCGCFGTADLQVTAAKRLAEDFGLLALCLWLWVSEVRNVRARLQFESGTV